MINIRGNKLLKLILLVAFELDKYSKYFFFLYIMKYYRKKIVKVISKIEASLLVVRIYRPWLLAFILI